MLSSNNALNKISPFVYQLHHLSVHKYPNKYYPDFGESYITLKVFKFALRLLTPSGPIKMRLALVLIL
jgi:hypothetical protein